MSFLREILDEFVIGWDEKRYDKWKEKDDRRWNARTMKPLLTRTVSWSELDYSGDGEMKERAPDYPEEVLQWLEEYEDLHLAVEDYDDRYPSLRGKDPEKMVLEEVLAMITWIIRTERVLPGTLVDALETGTMEALTKRMYRVTHYSEKQEPEETE